jgi:hypothetical protein
MNELDVNPLCCCYSEFSYIFVVSVAFATGGCCIIIREGLRMRVDCSELTVLADGGISGFFLYPRIIDDV